MQTKGKSKWEEKLATKTDLFMLPLQISDLQICGISDPTDNLEQQFSLKNLNHQIYFLKARLNKQICNKTQTLRLP